MIGFLWDATRGYRLRVSHSPYLRWRIETYWGLHADTLTPAEFWRFCREHRGELWRFLRWAGRMRNQSQAA